MMLSVFIVEAFVCFVIPVPTGNKVRSTNWTCLVSSGWKRDIKCFFVSYSSMNKQWLEHPTRTCDLATSFPGSLI